MPHDNDPLQKALDELSKAHGPQALAEAFSRVKSSLRRQRRIEQASSSKLASGIMEGVRLAAQLKAAGTPQADINRGMEALVRDLWPKTREWKYVCQRCNDTGLEMRVCRKGERCDGVSTRTDAAKEQAGRYDRLCKLDPDSDYEHEYGVPCYCGRGNRFRQTSRDNAPNFEQATKSKPMSRFGR